MSPLTIDIRLVSAIYYSESTWKEVDESFIESLMKKKRMEMTYRIFE